MKIHINITNLPFEITAALYHEVIAQGFEVRYVRNGDNSKNYLETDSDFDFDKMSPIYHSEDSSATDTWLKILDGEHEFFHKLMRRAKGEECQAIELNGEIFML